MTISGIRPFSDLLTIYDVAYSLDLSKREVLLLAAVGELPAPMLTGTGDPLWRLSELQDRYHCSQTWLWASDSDREDEREDE